MSHKTGIQTEVFVGLTCHETRRVLVVGGENQVDSIAWFDRDLLDALKRRGNKLSRVHWQYQCSGTDE